MNMIIEEVYPSNKLGFNTVLGTINGKDFRASIYEGTRKVESIKIENTYVFVENEESAVDVAYEPANAKFVFDFQIAINKNTQQISAS